MHRIMIVAALIGLLVGCQSTAYHPPTSYPGELDVTLIAAQSDDQLGSGQGVDVRDGNVYLYGDADTGVIRQYRVVEKQQRLQYAGRQVRLTHHGKDLIPHPTGLTHHPDYGTFIGNTVGGVGTIYHIDWRRLWRERNLDNAVLNVIEDDLALNGTRPEFVNLGGDGKDHWVIATSDYGDVGNEVRFYDPAALAKAGRTSDAGVLVSRHRCGPWVQSLHWWDAQRRLVLVQNQIAGLRWRLTPVPLVLDDFRRAGSVDLDMPVDELEGFHLLDSGDDDGGRWGVFFSSSPTCNIWLGRVSSERE